MKILVIGTGMYVTGRGTEGYGTILPAISAFQKEKNCISNVYLVGTNIQHTLEAKSKSIELNDMTGIPLPLEFFPDDQDSEKTFLQILENVELLDCAIVAVPDHLHFDVTRACLEKRLHTLVVKPLTPNLDEAQKLVALAKKYNLHGVVEFHKRWDRQNLILRDEYQSGKFGVPLYTWTEYSQRKSIPSRIFRSWVEQINILQYLGIHYIDIIRFVTGAIPVRVMAVGQKGWLIQQGIDVCDSIQSIVEWETPAGHRFSQTLLVNWIDPEKSTSMSDQKIKFVGSQGRFEGDQKERGVRLLYDNQNLEEPNPDFCRPYRQTDGSFVWEGYGIDSVTSFLSDISNIKEGRCSPLTLEGQRPTFQESIFPTSVVESAAASLIDHSKWKNVNIA